MMTAIEARKKGWRPLAGFFHEGDERDARMAQLIMTYISVTGGRCVMVREKPGLFGLWRPETEMETVRQTQKRVIREGGKIKMAN